MNKLALVFLSAIALLVQSAWACDFCMLAQGVNPYLTSNGRGITAATNFTQSDHVYDKAQNISSQGKQEEWFTYSLTGFYAFTPEFTVLLTVPYTVKNNIDYDSGSGLNTGQSVSGIADVTATGRYTVFRQHTLESTLIGGVMFGVKLPTGSSNATDPTGAPIDRHALPGTGSFDFDIGFTGSYAMASGLMVTLDVVDRIPTTGKWNGNAHRYGDMLNYTSKLFYRATHTEAGASFMPFIGISGETMGMEKGVLNDDGSYNPNLYNPSTGGTILYGDIGVHAILSPTTLADVGFSKAFWRYENYDPSFDTDPAQNYKIQFSLTYLF